MIGMILDMIIIIEAKPMKMLLSDNNDDVQLSESRNHAEQLALDLASRDEHLSSSC